MANNKSAKKRIKINKRNQQNNKSYKSSIRSLVKKFRRELEFTFTSMNGNETLEIEKQTQLKKSLSSLYSMIDKSVKRNVLHKNKASRQKSKLANYLQFILGDIII